MTLYGKHARALTFGIFIFTGCTRTVIVGKRVRSVRGPGGGSEVERVEQSCGETVVTVCVCVCVCVVCVYMYTHTKRICIYMYVYTYVYTHVTS